jgi:hypothetical protein
MISNRRVGGLFIEILLYPLEVDVDVDVDVSIASHLKGNLLDGEGV